MASDRKIKLLIANTANIRCLMFARFILTRCWLVTSIELFQSNEDDRTYIY